MSSDSVLRVAVLNDYEIVVAGIAAVLEEFTEVEVVELDSRMPVVSDVDVILYDTFGQVQGGAIEVDTWLESGTAKFVVFTWNIAPDVVQQSLAAGVHGVVSKGVSGKELVEALQAVHSGETVTPQSAGQPEGDDFGSWPGAEHGLSAREAEVLGLICQGFSNKDIAARTFLGINTVKTYIRTAYKKIGVDSRTRAVLWGIDHGLQPSTHRVIRDDED